MKGTRLPDRHDDGTFPEGLCDGCYWKSLDDGSFHIITPNGLHGCLRNHHVEEHEDSTITVVAGPWGSNSILTSNGTGNRNWHGYIKHGVWEEV